MHSIILYWRSLNSVFLLIFFFTVLSCIHLSSSHVWVMTRARPRLQIIGSPRGAAQKFDANRVIGFAFFWSGQNRVLFLVTRLPRLLLMPTFCPLKCGIFHGISAKNSGGAAIEDAPVVAGCKKIEIYVRASAETNTFSVHNINIKGKMIGDVKFEMSTCIYMW